MEALDISRSEVLKQKEETKTITAERNRLRRQNTALRKENHALNIKVTDLESKIERLESKISKLRVNSIESMWLPGVIQGVKGLPFDNQTRLLVMQFLTFGVPAGAVATAIAAVLEMVFRQPDHMEYLKDKLTLPSRRTVQQLRNELAFVNRATIGVKIASSDRVNTWGSDASPYYGNEVLAGALQLESKTDDRSHYEDWLLGFSQLPDQKSATEAAILKTNVFDRIAASVMKMNMVLEEEIKVSQLENLYDVVLAKFESMRDCIEIQSECKCKHEIILCKNFESLYEHSEAAALKGCIVDSKRVGVYRLGGSVGQSDNAPAALRVKYEMAILIAKDAEEKYGREAWEVSGFLSFIHPCILA